MVAGKGGWYVVAKGGWYVVNKGGQYVVGREVEVVGKNKSYRTMLFPNFAVTIFRSDDGSSCEDSDSQG